MMKFPPQSHQNSELTGVGTYFSGAVDVLDGEDVPQAVEQHFGQSRDQLSGGDQHVHTPPPVGGRAHTHTQTDEFGLNREKQNAFSYSLLSSSSEGN